MRYNQRKLFYILLFLLIGVISCSPRQDHPKDYSVEEAFQNIDDSSIVWLDIRESQEFITLPKLSITKHVPLSDFQNSFSSLHIEKDQTIYIICRSGNRSKRLQQHLISEGYTDVVNILGGMKAWSKMKQ